MGKTAQAQAGRDRARDARLKAARERRLKMDPDQLAREQRIDEASVDVEVASVEEGARLVFSGTHGHGPRLAQGHYEHEVAALPGGGSRITHRMRLSGALAAPIGLLLGRMLGVSATPEAVRAVARLAEARS